MFKGAIIGFGKVAEKAHAPAFKGLSPEFSIEAVADGIPERLEAASQYFHGARLYKSADEIFQKEKGLDFVDIATPPHLHAKLTLLALQHRLHVLCEKPLALNLKDFESIRPQAQSQTRAVFTVHNWKYSPQFIRLREIVNSKAIGDVVHAEVHSLRDKPAAQADSQSGSWRTQSALAGGGILVDHGWHSFYLIQSVVNQIPRQVTASLQIPSTSSVEVVATCLVQFDNATALVHLSWKAAYRSNWGIIYGKKGNIELRDDQLILQTREGTLETTEFAQKLSAGSQHLDWFSSMLSEFKGEMVNPRIRGNNLKEAEVCLNLLTFAYKSHRLGGKTVALPLLDGGPAPPHDGNDIRLRLLDFT